MATLDADDRRVAAGEQYEREQGAKAEYRQLTTFIRCDDEDGELSHFWYANDGLKLRYENAALLVCPQCQDRNLRLDGVAIDTRENQVEVEPGGVRVSPQQPYRRLSLPIVRTRCHCASGHQFQFELVDDNGTLYALTYDLKDCPEDGEGGFIEPHGL